jgi:poly(3-hydroxybutyrate) depolymerase
MAVSAASLGLLLACSNEPGAENRGVSSGGAGAGGVVGASGTTTTAGSGVATGGSVVENAGAGGVAGSAIATGGNAGESGSSSPGGGSAGVSSGGNAAVASSGCGTPATDPTGQFVFDKTILVEGAQRKYSLRLPTAYDPNRPYRTIFSLHGCGSHHDQLINMQDAMGFDAIIIAPEQVSGNCFDDQSSMSKDLPVFDALVTWAEASLCVDQSRIFSIGFSSGSWMTNILGCQRANVLRAKANVSGGLTGAVDVTKDCKGNVAGIFLHDKDDTQNTLAMGTHARDMQLLQNGCSMTTTPYDDVPANTAGLCVQYDGCKSGYPVVWCQTSGINHDPQQMRSPELFWRFLSKL